MSIFYTLEICPLSKEAGEFYKTHERLNDNAGFDLFSARDINITDSSVIDFIPFGIKARMTKTTLLECGDIAKVEDCHYWLAPRSSIFKSGLIMANSMGVIDHTYRGELKGPVWSITGDSHIKAGDRLFQIVAPDMGHIKHIKIVDALSSTQRGANGFGSTGI
jgi:dUTPase